MSVRKFLSQRTVMPYSETPPKPASDALVELARRASRKSLIGSRRVPSPSPSELDGERLDLQAVDADDAEALR